MSKSIEEQILDGDMTPIMAANRLALIKSMTKHLKQQELALRKYLTTSMDDKEHLTTQVGEIEKRGGGEPSCKVTDPVAYGDWLNGHGYGDNVTTVVMPSPHMMDKHTLELVVRDNKGELPDGIDIKNGSPETVAVSKTMDWEKVMANLDEVADAQNLLGIEPQEQSAPEPIEPDDWSGNEQ